MYEVRFAWDEVKNRINQKKHGVSFEEAVTAFNDEQAYEYPDPAHFDGEDRFLLLGISAHLRILVVAHCYRESDEVIRIISARRATLKEAKYYEEAT